MVIASITLSAIFVAILFVVKRFRNSSSNSSAASATNVVTPTVSVELMDEFFTREAGRFCSHCGIHGSHYTDRHDIFASFVTVQKNKVSHN